MEHVDHFVYLGSVVTADNSLDRDISRRLSRATYAFQTLQPVLRNRHLSSRTKCTLYRAIVVNNLVYGSEAWVPTARQMRRLDVFHLQCLRRILGISRLDHVTNLAILQKAKTDYIDVIARRYQLRWLGHVGRMRSADPLPDGRWQSDRVSLRMLSAWLSGPRPRGTPSQALGPAGRWFRRRLSATRGRSVALGLVGSVSRPWGVGETCRFLTWFHCQRGIVSTRRSLPGS